MKTDRVGLERGKEGGEGEGGFTEGEREREAKEQRREGGRESELLNSQ